MLSGYDSRYAGPRLPWAVLVIALLTGMTGCYSFGGNSGEKTTQAVFAVTDSVPEAELPKGVTKGYRIKANPDSLAHVSDSQEISAFIALPDGRILGFRVSDTVGEPPSIWRGRLIMGNDPVTGLTLSRVGERYTGSFSFEGNSFRIAPRGGEGHWLLQLAPEEARPRHPPRVPD